MGDDSHCDIGPAFRQFLADAARLSDGGKSVRRELHRDLVLVLNNDDYGRWVDFTRTNSETIKAVGGRFIMPEQVPSLMAVLDESFDEEPSG